LLLSNCPEERKAAVAKELEEYQQPFSRSNVNSDSLRGF
jgi:hypothetical protein